MTDPVKIAVLVSGGGTNLQALIDAEASGALHSGRLSLVISSREGAFALERAARAGIPSHVVTRAACGSQKAFEEQILKLLREYGIELIVLAGFMSILSADFTAAGLIPAGEFVNVRITGTQDGDLTGEIEE